ncbi:MAG: SMP-30/gluconolactonase/LRE family protein [Cyanobacteria bacterium TGS_CYA1]|nr:SMP-30/gluconolactonase/LRE family protein [Cyanobacteria bacterium TGS_CYA1]
MSFRTRLQSFVENRQKIQIWYGMGCHNTVTGRVLGVDHDHIDVESYSHESDGQIHIRRILVPLHLILHIDITTAEVGEEIEVYDSGEDSLPSSRGTKRNNGSVGSVIDLPDAPRGYGVKILSQLNASYSNRFSRMTSGPGGIYFSCDGSVWFVDSTGQTSEYARIRGNCTISGLRFDRKGVLYVATIQGTIYKIDPNKSGRILAQLDGSKTGGGTFLSDIAIGPREEVYVANFPSNTGGIFKIDKGGEYEAIVGGPGNGTQGLLLDPDGFLWCLEHSSGSVVKRSFDGREISRITVADSDSFNFADGYDGNLTIDSLGRLYVTLGRQGCVIRINREGKAEEFLKGLVNPTGIAFGNDGALFVLEAGRSRVLRIAAQDKADRTTSAPMLN